MNDELKRDPYADFMDALFHSDTVTVSLKGIGATDWDTETIHKAILHKTAPTATSAWRTDAPPRDGTTFLAWVGAGCIVDNPRACLMWYDQEFHTFQQAHPIRGCFMFTSNILAWASITPYKEGNE